MLSCIYFCYKNSMSSSIAVFYLGSTTYLKQLNNESIFCKLLPNLLFSINLKEMSLFLGYEFCSSFSLKLKGEIVINYFKEY